MATLGDSAVAVAPGAANGSSHGMKSKGRLSALWGDNSTAFDAWLVAAAAQIGTVLITIPYSFSELGYAWGISAILAYAVLGAWPVYLLVWLYLEFKSRLDLQGKVTPEKYIVQYYEVIGGLTGKFGYGFTYFCNTVQLTMVSIIQLVASASNLYYANASLDKRQWTYILGGVAFLAVFVPNFGHFRSGAFIGVATTTIASIYLLIAALSYGQPAGVKHTGGLSNKVDFFTGVANILAAYGGHGITIEILESMKRPSAYKYVCIAVLAYAILVTFPSGVAVYWSAGDRLLTHSNAFAVLPRSGWQTFAIACLVTHQAMGFVILSHPVFLVTEKAFRVHTRRFYLRVLVRIPVVAFMFFIALAVPFLGPINALLGSLGIAVGMYVIPIVAFLYTYRTKSARENSPVKPPPFLPTWWLLFLVNMILLVFTLIVGVGFGSWGAISNIVRQVHTFGFFDSCFQCPPKSK